MNSWTLTKEFTFEAAHKLVNHDGKCARLHGHSWKGRVVLTGVALHGHGPKQGMLVDFGDVKGALAPIIDSYLDHHYLNETLQTESPTSEFVAYWLYKQFQAMLGDPTQTKLYWPLVQLVAVEIDETCTSRCRYEEPIT